MKNYSSIDGKGDIGDDAPLKQFLSQEEKKQLQEKEKEKKKLELEVQKIKKMKEREEERARKKDEQRKVRSFFLNGFLFFPPFTKGFSKK